MSRQFTLVTNEETSLPPANAAINNNNPIGEIQQELPPIFADSLSGFLGAGNEPLATLYVASEDVLEEQVPARALALIENGVLFMEEGEVTLLSTPWGVKSLFYPYTQITGVGIGKALLTGRFTLHGSGTVPPCEITFHSEDTPGFEAAARLIGEQIAATAIC